jgi:hypothetical protein
MMASKGASRSAMVVWWWTSVPYLLIFTLMVLTFKPTPGFLAHVILPLLLLFWMTLYSSLAWVLVALVIAVRRPAVRFFNLTRLALGIAAALLGVYLEFFWAGNV